MYTKKTKKPRKQRKRMYNAPEHRRRKDLTVRLDDKLIEKYNFVLSRIPIRTGDKVKVVRGGFRDPDKDLEVKDVHTKKNTIELEGATVMKVDGKQVPRCFKPSNLTITKLNLSDRWRRDKIEELGIEIEEEDLEEELEEEFEEEELEDLEEEELEDLEEEELEDLEEEPEDED